MTPPDPGFGPAPPGAKKFPDYVPPTKVHYDGVKPATLHLRKCKLVTNVGGRAREQLDWRTQRPAYLSVFDRLIKRPGTK